MQEGQELERAIKEVLRAEGLTRLLLLPTLDQRKRLTSVFQKVWWQKGEDFFWGNFFIKLPDAATEVLSRSFTKSAVIPSFLKWASKEGLPNYQKIGVGIVKTYLEMDASWNSYDYLGWKAAGEAAIEKGVARDFLATFLEGLNTTHLRGSKLDLLGRGLLLWTFPDLSPLFQEDKVLQDSSLVCSALARYVAEAESGSFGKTFPKALASLPPERVRQVVNILWENADQFIEACSNFRTSFEAKRQDSSNVSLNLGSFNAFFNLKSYFYSLLNLSRGDPPVDIPEDVFKKYWLPPKIFEEQSKVFALVSAATDFYENTKVPIGSRIHYLLFVSGDIEDFLQPFKQMSETERRERWEQIILFCEEANWAWPISPNNRKLQDKAIALFKEYSLSPPDKILFDAYVLDKTRLGNATLCDGTPLIHKAIEEHMAPGSRSYILAIVLATGGDPNALAPNGKRPLETVLERFVSGPRSDEAVFSLQKAVFLLRVFGADHNLPNSKGQTLWDVLQTVEDEDKRIFLKAFHFDMDPKEFYELTKEGWKTIRFYGSTRQREPFVRFLLSEGPATPVLMFLQNPPPDTTPPMEFVSKENLVAFFERVLKEAPIEALNSFLWFEQNLPPEELALLIPPHVESFTP